MAQKVKFTFTAINNTKAAFNQLNKSLSFAGKTAAVTSKAVLGIGAAATEPLVLLLFLQKLMLMH